MQGVQTKRTDTRKFASRVEIVTPELAAKWLEERNNNNRVLNNPLKDRTVESYASDMKADKWHLTGDAIKFDTNGDLLDGQHRLWACVLADTPFETMVVHNVDPDARIVIDTGKKRTLGHYLQMTGETQAIRLASAVSLGLRWDRGCVGTGGSRLDHRTLSHEESLEWLEQNQDVRDSIAFGSMFNRDVRFGATPATVAHYLNARVDHEAADEFWLAAAEGVDLKAGSPILALRRWAVNIAAARAAKKTDVRNELALVYFLKAMQLWRAGKTARLLKVHAAEEVTTWER
jgi:hypothetical protein